MTIITSIVLWSIPAETLSSGCSLSNEPPGKDTPADAQQAVASFIHRSTKTSLHHSEK